MAATACFEDLNCRVGRRDAECGISSQQWNFQTKRRLTVEGREGKQRKSYRQMARMKEQV
jgi:hypothetical protein